MVKHNQAFNRLKLLTGDSVLSKLQRTGVIIFGIGGVGSWCAEALVRSGLGRLTMVDPDLICRTNINRQLQATSSTVGKIKVMELADRLREINPNTDITVRQEAYTRGKAEEFKMGTYDYVIDAIDSLSAKVDLIISATDAGATVFTALGASCKIDPTRIRVSPLWESQGCHLGKLVRKRLRRCKFNGNPLCVYSEELLPVKYGSNGFGCSAYSRSQRNPDQNENDRVEITECYNTKKQSNGSAVHITGTFGFYLAGLVIQDVMSKAESFGVNDSL